VGARVRFWRVKRAARRWRAKQRHGDAHANASSSLARRRRQNAGMAIGGAHRRQAAAGKLAAGTATGIA